MADDVVAGDSAAATVASGDAVASNGVDQDAIRAAFMAGVETPTTETPDEKPAEPAKEEAPKVDDDSDLDEDDSDEEKPDPDDDLDDDDEEVKPDEKVDDETAKRLSHVRRTDKRLREQRENEWASRDSDFAARIKDVEAKWAPRVEAAERFERLAHRASIDPAAALQALGVQEDQYEHVAQILYTLSKAKDDPKARTAAAQLMKDRELTEEIGSLKKWKEERERSEKERDESSKADQALDAYLDTVAAATTDKTPLAKQYLKANPKQAKADLAAIAYRIGQETGTPPAPKSVMIAFEKDRRRVLRDHGIDPRAATPAQAATQEPKIKTKTAPEKAKTKEPVKTEETKLSPKEEFLRLSGNYD
jgi:hypothetical protein